MTVIYQRDTETEVVVSEQAFTSLVIVGGLDRYPGGRIERCSLIDTLLLLDCEYFSVSDCRVAAPTPPQEPNL